MSAKVRDAIRKREQAKIRPEPEKPARRPVKRPEPVKEESGLGTITTADLPGTDG